jgi:hypothetical protein
MNSTPKKPVFHAERTKSYWGSFAALDLLVFEIEGVRLSADC